MDNRKFLPFIILGIVSIVVLIYLSSEIFITLKSGERGVIWKRFNGGVDFTTVLTPGFHMKAPWNEVYVYNVRENTIDESMQILDKNGLSIDVDVSVRFFPIIERVPYLHEYFGPEYIKNLVRQEVRATVRRVMGQFSAEEIYSTKRSIVEKNIKTETKNVLINERNNIQIQQLLIRAVVLPKQIKNAIESKQMQEEKAKAYVYILQKEESEAERLRIQAEGIAKYNNIINNSLSEKVLKQRGIDATLELAKSENSKVVVIGNGADGLPMILGNN
jgi:regulator of protease activity HflC (stomatin/prohibitin superfamily)